MALTPPPPKNFFFSFGIRNTNFSILAISVSVHNFVGNTTDNSPTTSLKTGLFSLNANEKGDSARFGPINLSCPLGEENFINSRFFQNPILKEQWFPEFGKTKIDPTSFVGEDPSRFFLLHPKDILTESIQTFLVFKACVISDSFSTKIKNFNNSGGFAKNSTISASTTSIAQDYTFPQGYKSILASGDDPLTTFHSSYPTEDNGNFTPSIYDAISTQTDTTTSEIFWYFPINKNLDSQSNSSFKLIIDGELE